MIPVTTKGRTNLFSLSSLSAVPQDLAVFIIWFLMVWTMDGLRGLDGSGVSGESAAAGGAVSTIGGGLFGRNMTAIEDVGIYYMLTM